jgi:hypothetical protein
MSQNVPPELTETEVKPYKTGAFDAYVTFCALAGMMVDDTGNLSYMSVPDFCERYRVNRHTLYRWKNNTPNFAMQVRLRRDEVFPLARESAAFNRLFLIGMTSLGRNSLHNDQRAAVDALKTALGHGGNLQMPVQRQDIKIQGGLMEVLEAAAADGILEGEVVGTNNLDESSSGQTASALPPTS